MIGSIGATSNFADAHHAQVATLIERTDAARASQGPASKLFTIQCVPSCSSSCRRSASGPCTTNDITTPVAVLARRWTQQSIPIGDQDFAQRNQQTIPVIRDDLQLDFHVSPCAGRLPGVAFRF